MFLFDLKGSRREIYSQKRNINKKLNLELALVLVLDTKSFFTLEKIDRLLYVNKSTSLPFYKNI